MIEQFTEKEVRVAELDKQLIQKDKELLAKSSELQTVTRDKDAWNKLEKEKVE